MDFSKQYPTPSIDTDDELFDIESISGRLGLSVVDLINLARSGDRQSAENLSTRSGVPTEEILSLLHAAKKFFIGSLKSQIESPLDKAIPTGLSELDESVLGGIPLGQITEVFGASGCGKSQFLLHLTLQALSLEESENNSCIFISTETVLESRRLSDFSKDVPGALDKISCIYCPDLEQQDHILFTQLRLKLQKDISEGKVPRVIVIDSIAHHLRAEDSHLNTSSFLRSHLAWQEEQLSGVPMYNQEKLKFDQITNRFLRSDAWFKNWTARKYYLFTLYSHLAELARTFNVAVVLANQVSDVMDPTDENSNNDLANNPEVDDPLLFNNQVGAFSGWNSLMSSLTVSFEEYEQEGPKENDRLKRKRKAERGHSDAQESYLKESQHDNARSIRGPKRKVPAMGYAWSKLVANRVLLWKNYSAQFEHDAESAPRKNSFISNPSTKKTDSSTESPEILQKSETPGPSQNVSGFKVRRFARAVSYRAQAGTGTAEFEISQNGILEVRGNVMSARRT